MSATRLGGGLTGAQIEQITRWASGVAREHPDLREAAAVIVQLATLLQEARARANGEDTWDWDDGDLRGEPLLTLPELADARRLSQQLGATEVREHRAAGRALAILCQELEAHGAMATGAAGSPPEGEERGRAPGGVSPLAFLPAGVALVVAALLVVGARAAAPELSPRGPASGALLGRAELQDLAFSVAGDPARLAGVRFVLDGKDVTAQARRSGDRLVLRPRSLADGEHVLRARLGGLALWSGAGASWRFRVDSRPPQIRLASDLATATARAPFSLRVPVEGATAVEVNGKPVRLQGGAVTLHGEPPATFVISSRDAAGNSSRHRLSVEAAPRLPANPLRAVHVTADGWANPALRAGVLQLAEAHRINAVELDLKDESGVVGWDAPVPLARRIGAVERIYDLRAAVQQLHSRGLRVIGRLVVFRDPKLAEWAWRTGRRGEVVQTPANRPFTGGYCRLACFTNLANDEVRRYNIDVGVAAARLGVDDILYDYIRRPDGPLASMRFPGFSGNPADAVVSFLAQTRSALAPTKTFLGVSVFGIAVTRPDEIAQDVPRMAREVDYVAPLVYPSHWAPGEYGVTDPNVQPYDIVLASLRDFRRAVEGTGARLVPWLQDFSLGVHYGPEQVRAQIQAAHDAGIDEWILWDPNVTYSATALATGAPLPTTGQKQAGIHVVAPRVLPPNELGEIPVLMFHQVRPDPTSEYDETPADFQAELERLYREGYRPITAAALVDGRIDVPKGTTPVVLTFDDATANQAALRDDGTIDPKSAAGILLGFARTHPGFRPVATFYVNREPFAAGERTQALLRWLVAHGFEIGNHTRDHANLGRLDARGVQAEIGEDNAIIHSYLPGISIETMALPYGVLPRSPGLALAGRWRGERYAFKGVMLVGAGPAPSPFSSDFDPGAIPRIRSASHNVAYDARDWLDRLDAQPRLRYVSDGDPKHVSFPRALSRKLAPAYSALAKPY
jgi:hypothetical protein